MKGEEKERWASVPGYGGAYEVSSLGNVRSWRNGSWGLREKPRPVRLITNTYGYKFVNLYNESTRKQHRVHSLVLEAFVGPCPDGFVGCHMNDVPADNRLANLRWGSRIDNRNDAIRNGRDMFKTQRNQAKLLDVIGDVRSMLTQGYSNRQVARRYGVSSSRISDIRTGKTKMYSESKEGAP